jgi:hypothetical protein
MACDPLFAEVELLVYGNSAAGSTVFTDSSSVGNTMTGGGTTQATASNQLFSQNTISVGNTALTTPITNAGPLDLANVTSYTVEMWIWSVSFSGALFFGMGVYAANCLFLECTGANAGVIGSVYHNGSNASFGPTTSHLVGSQWNHVAVVVNSGVLQVYVNGVAGIAGGLNLNGIYPAPSWSTGGGQVSLGTFGGSPLNGQIAEFRVTNGAARYTANFAPPTAPFPNVNCTQSVPNLVGLTLAAAQAANAAAGYVTTVQESNHPTIQSGLVISQNPPAGTLSVLGTNVILQLSTGPTTTAGMGGDVWGSTGGGQISSQAPEPVGQALAYATQQNNAVAFANQSVLAAMATGTSITQNTPATSVPTTPAMG